MHDTCSEENDRLRLVCKKSDTVTEPPACAAAALDAELSLSASAQLPGDMLTLPTRPPPPPPMSLGDRYDDMPRSIGRRHRPYPSARERRAAVPRIYSRPIDGDDDNIMIYSDENRARPV